MRDSISEWNLRVAIVVLVLSIHMCFLRSVTNSHVDILRQSPGKGTCLVMVDASASNASAQKDRGATISRPSLTIERSVVERFIQQDRFDPVIASPIVEDMPASSGEQFYPYEELDAPAVPLSEFSLPSSFDQFRIIRAQVEIYIDKSGEVQDVRVLLVDAPEFQEVLQSSIRATRFSPAIREGLPVNSVKRMEIAIRY